MVVCGRECWCRNSVLPFSAYRSADLLQGMEILTNGIRIQHGPPAAQTSSYRQRSWQQHHQHRQHCKLSTVLHHYRQFTASQSSQPFFGLLLPFEVFYITMTASLAPDPSKVSAIYASAPTHRCSFCPRTFVIEGRCLRHEETAHGDQLAAKRAGEAIPRPTFPAPEGRPTAETLPLHLEDDEDDEDGPSRFQRILHLLRPLTSLVTRITTTTETQDADYDSDPLEQPQDFFTPDPDLPTPSEEDEPTRKAGDTEYRETFGYEPTIFGEGTPDTRPTRDSPWYPFRSGYEFKLAKWMMDANLSKSQIDAFFNKGLARAPPTNPDGSEGTCFTSAHTLGQLLDQVDPDLAMDKWTPVAVDHHGAGLIEFRYRSLENIIRHIFKQASHADYMTYMPYKEYHRKTGYRLYSEMASAQWWWHKQVTNPPTRPGSY